MATQAGTWIGGSANQAAMKEVFAVGPGVFSAFVAVDVIFSYGMRHSRLERAGKSAQ